MKTCKKCGKEITEENAVHYRLLCKDCHYQYNREYKTERRKKLKEETGYSLTEKERQYRNEYCTKRRIKAKLETGKTYRSEKEAERARKYAREHIKKTSELTNEQLEKRKKNGVRYLERKKMIDFVNECDGLDFNDFYDVL